MCMCCFLGGGGAQRVCKGRQRNAPVADLLRELSIECVLSLRAGFLPSPCPTNRFPTS